jgi:hypothetical protein
MTNALTPPIFYCPSVPNPVVHLHAGYEDGRHEAQREYYLCITREVKITPLWCVSQLIWSCGGDPLHDRAG